MSQTKLDTSRVVDLLLRDALQRHPLWYDEIRQAWCCMLDPGVVAPLGGVADLNPLSKRDDE